MRRVFQAFLALGFVAALLAAIGADILKTYHQAPRRTEAAQIAENALLQVSTPNSGWRLYERSPIFRWERDAEGWLLEDDMVLRDRQMSLSNAALVGPFKPRHPLHAVPATARAGLNALELPVQFPAATTVIRAESQDRIMQRVRFVAWDAFVPAECNGFVGCLLFMKDKDGMLFQARSRAALVPGRWTTVAFDIRGDSADVTPLNHLGHWDENQATQIQYIGITVYGENQFSGSVQLSNFRGWVRDEATSAVAIPSNPNSAIIRVNVPPPKTRDNEAPKPPGATDPNSIAVRAAAVAPSLEVINLRTNPPCSPADSYPKVGQFETLTLRFELNKQVENPFDPDEADITCTVVDPNGQKFEHIAFWYQDYEPLDKDGEEAIPLGTPEWRVRIAPHEIGEYRCVLHAKVGKESLEVPAGSFMCEPSNERGFLRVSKTDPRFFEFENGEFYYPIGHNIHTPIDERGWRALFNRPSPVGRGMAMYADFFEKMDKNGENVAEVWMSSWWLGLEWSSKWKDYYGIGRYSLKHAWKFDRLLDMARTHNILIHPCIDNHGKVSARCDPEWQLNPFNAANGGWVRTASEYFTDEAARKWHRNRLRYVCARWATDSMIFGWEVINEYDLTGLDGPQRHMSPQARDWAEEMIGYLRNIDPYKRPITIHYCHDFNTVDMHLARVFDYVAADGYRSDRGYYNIAGRMNTWMHQKGTFENARVIPVWVTEYGGHFFATQSDALDADLLGGIWSTWMSDGAGVPLLWWYDFIDQKNLYPYFRGFANYARGEDRRGIHGTLEPAPIGAGDSGSLALHLYRWENGAYGWVFNQAALQALPAKEKWPKYPEGVESAVRKLSAGTYRIEYWDCIEGTIVRSDEQTIGAGEAVKLKFPAFTCLMAIKVKPAAKK